MQFEAKVSIRRQCQVGGRVNMQSRIHIRKFSDTWHLIKIKDYVVICQCIQGEVLEKLGLFTVYKLMDGP